MSTIKMTNKTLRAFITDRLLAYAKSAKIFGTKTYHSKNVHLKGQMNNNIMGRLNGEIRYKERCFAA